MKAFYTVRDIEDMAARGEMSIQLSDDVVVTMAARERAQELGVKLLPYVQELPSRRRWREAPAESISLPGVRSLSPAESTGTLAAQVTAAVTARLAGSVSQDVIDAVVRGVLSKLEERCR
jgi:hypothetical protein